ncbi:hypothetical protein FRC04_006545 [Tulasnella sp. 424]|nr:hypothetical protein FRC04_006545 [Tulasnella sp. 424]KAG8980996.1 hypothetical protein FRC05_003895 [Tulasnella sp. 425]
MRSSHLVLSLALASKTALALAGQSRSKIELQDLNFVHTSDIHSWYRGHQKTDAASRYWDANIGDVASFVHHMKQKAERQGQDLFFVNSGDDTHGGGLSDSENPEGGRALAIHITLPYDVMTPGNHELEKRVIARNLYYNITSRLSDSETTKYLASNVNFIDDYGKEVPLAKRYKIWKTRGGEGRKVAALGVSFENKKTAHAGVRIQPIEAMVKEKWFVNDVLDSNPDIFLLVGHMSLSDKGDKWNVIHDAIRKRHPETPIFIFGGHSHQRDCRMTFDAVGRSIAIESGRYLETVGWVSAALTEPSEPLKFVRRYLDPNKDTFQRHSGIDKKSFDTETGKDVMSRFDELAKRMGLDEVYGCAPHTYNWDHEEYSKHAKDHVLNFYTNEVFPEIVSTKNITTGKPNPYFLLVNNGFMRGPIYQGKFTKDDKFVNTPYKQPFSFVKLPRLIADRVFEMLDHLQGTDDAVTDFGTASRSGGDRTALRMEGSEETPLTLGRYLSNEIVGRLTVTSPGYVTTDRCEELGPGDDTIHSAPGLKIQRPPTYVHSRSPSTQTLAKYELVDFVILHRLQDRARAVINAAIKMHNEFCDDHWSLCQPIPKIQCSAWKPYGTVDSSDAIMKYAQSESYLNC